MFQMNGIARIEDLSVEFHDIFARHWFDIGMNREYTIKLTPKDNSLAYRWTLQTPTQKSQRGGSRRREKVENDVKSENSFN